MYKIGPLPENAVIDNSEIPIAAYRMSHAVTRWNTANPSAAATFEIYTNKEDAEPPINAADAEPGQIYTRMSYPAGALSTILAIELDLACNEPPRQP